MCHYFILYLLHYILHKILNSFTTVLSGMQACLFEAPVETNRKQQCPGTPANHVLEQLQSSLQL